MRHLQQVMCQRFAQSLRTSNDAGSGAIRLSFRSLYLDATGHNVRSKRLTGHSTTEFNPLLPVGLEKSRPSRTILIGKRSFADFLSNFGALRVSAGPSASR
jgi:hypothetical protein